MLRISDIRPRSFTARFFSNLQKHYIVPELNLAVRLSAFRLPLKKALHAAARTGARGIEIDARNMLRPSELSDTACRQLRKMMEDLNLRIIAVRFQTRFGYDQLDRLDERIDATKQAMRMAYRLGANLVINQIGRVPEEKDSPRFQQLRAVMEDLGRHGTHVGSFLAAETGTEPGERLARLLNDLENAYVGVAFNPGNLIVNGFSVTDSLQALGGHIQLVEACDAVQDLARGRGIEVPLGQGTGDMPEILSLLEEQRYRGWFVVGREDPESADELTASVNYLKNL